MLTDAPLPPSLTHHITNPPDHDDASTAASSAPTPVHHLPLAHSREASIDGPSPEVPPTLADESINHVNGHLKEEDSDMHDHHSAAGLTASGNAPTASALLSKTAAVDIQARAASASGDDMEIDGESNLDLSDTEPLPSGAGPLTELHPVSGSSGQGPSAAQPHSTFKTQSPAPSHSRSRSPNGVPLHPSMLSDANPMPVDASVPATPALQDSQPDDASMADGERPAKRPRNAYEDSSASQPQPSSSANPAMQPAAVPTRPTKSISTTPFTPGQLKYAMSTVKQLKKSRDATAFLQPVDPVALNIPHYPSVITHPMDLSTVEKKLASTKKGELGDAGFYQNPDEFVADVRLIWFNCHTFNGLQSIFSQAADRLSETFERQMAHFPPPEDVKPTVPAKRPSPVASLPAKPKVTAPRRSSTSVPAARRDVGSPVATSFGPQSSAAARPKREVHAPPPKDSGYHDSSRANGAGRRVKRDDGTAEQLKYCLKIINGLFGRQYENWAWFFYDPVDPAHVPGYYDIIKKPMDMNTVKRKLEQDQYTNANQFYKDFKQIIENCYAFNPVGTVRDAGHKLEEEFNRRWANLPPLRPAEESEPESEDDPQSDIEQEKLLHSLEEQVTNLNRNIESLKSSIRDKKKRRERAREERRQAKLARQAAYNSRDDYSYGSKTAPKKGRTSSASQTNGNYKAAAAASPVASSSKQHHKSAAKGGGKKPNPPPPAAVEDDEYDAMDSPLDMAQKKELSEAIEKLEGDKLEKVISIIQDGVPGIGNNSEEIELEIDALPSAVLQRLYSFVIRPLKAANKPVNAYKVPKRAGSGNTGRTGAAATGGVKRKSMDEDAESRKIAELEAKAALLAGKAQPNQQPGAPQPPRGPGIGNGADEDESAQSSDESGSDEESDSD